MIYSDNIKSMMDYGWNLYQKSQSKWDIVDEKKPGWEKIFNDMTK